MKRIKVRAEHSYEVILGSSWIAEKKLIESEYEKVLYIVPKSLKGKLKLGKLEEVFYTPDAEKQKDEAIVSKLWKYCGDIGLKRNHAIVAIGGGATTDLGGFVAATWLRGIDWIAVPTTLAGAVDAAVGGKTGINSGHGKNLIGAFHSPKKVVVDTSFLKNLSSRDFSAGMAEVVKCGFISDPKILKLSENPKKNLDALIERAVKVKADVVSKDFKESRLREVLNYGHTLAHAIERVEKYQMRHGEAVSIGMVFAAELSAIKCGLSQSNVAAHRKILEGLNLPTSYKKNKFNELLALMQGDKKTRGNKLRFIGITKPGKVQWLEDVTESDLKKAYERICL